MAKWGADSQHLKKLSFQLHPSIASAYNSHNMPNDRDSENRNHNLDSSRMPREQDTYDSENNPFVAFRRFADEQVSSLLQSITGLPSAVSPPQSDRWTIFNDDQGYKSMAYRQRSDQSNAGERGYMSDSGAAGSSSRDGSETPSNNDGKNPEDSSQYQQTGQDDRWQSPSRRNQRSPCSAHPIPTWRHMSSILPGLPAIPKVWWCPIAR